MKRKIISLVLITTMLATSLMGCGSKEESNSKSNSEANNSETVIKEQATTSSVDEILKETEEQTTEQATTSPVEEPTTEETKPTTSVIDPTTKPTQSVTEQTTEPTQSVTEQTTEPTQSVIEPTTSPVVEETTTSNLPTYPCLIMPGEIEPNGYKNNNSAVYYFSETDYITGLYDNTDRINCFLENGLNTPFEYIQKPYNSEGVDTLMMCYYWLNTDPNYWKLDQSYNIGCGVYQGKGLYLFICEVDEWENGLRHDNVPIY